MNKSQYFQSENLLVVQHLYLKYFSLIYLAAFASWFPQISTLYGPNGLLPVDVSYSIVLKIFQTYLDNYGEGPIYAKLQNKPTIMLWAKQLHSLISNTNIFNGTNPEETILMIICLLGTSLSIWIFIDRSNKLLRFESFFALWVLYLSLYHVGQTFSSFQWDIMLIESGFITLFFTPTYHKGKIYLDSLGVASRELLRWLGFKLYFSSGLTKLLSGCPTWWDLSALHHHFQSQCIPNPISWWAHQIPFEIKRFLVAGNFICLIFGAIAFYVPLRGVRIIGFLLQVLMQVSIILTGNYNYFNLLSICISIAIIDDEFIRNFVPRFVLQLLNSNKYIQKMFDERNKPQEIHGKFGLVLGLLLWSGFIIFCFLYVFPYQQVLFAQNTKLPFNVSDVQNILSNSVFLNGIEIFAYGFTAYYLVYFLIQQYPNFRATSFGRVRLLLKFTAAMVLFVLMQGYSSFQMRRGLGFGDPSALVLGNKIPTWINKYGGSFQLANSYGLFRRMTGVGGRPEIIIEGTADGKKWQEYEFYYKPGNLSVPLPWAVPHQPRVDWQMWFAALDHQIEDPWLVNMVYKLLRGEMTVKGFFAKDPFPQTPPKQIRIRSFKYFLTNFDQYRDTNKIWTRKFDHDYLIPIDLSSQALQNFVQNQGFIREDYFKTNPLNNINIWYYIVLNALIPLLWNISFKSQSIDKKVC